MINRREVLATGGGIGATVVAGCVSPNELFYGESTADVVLVVNNDTPTKQRVGVMIPETKDDLTPIVKDRFVIESGANVSKTYTIVFKPDRITVYVYAARTEVEEESFREVSFEDGGFYQYEYSILNQEWSEFETTEV